MLTVASLFSVGRKRKKTILMERENFNVVKLIVATTVIDLFLAKVSAFLRMFKGIFRNYPLKHDLTPSTFIVIATLSIIRVLEWTEESQRFLRYQNDSMITASQDFFIRNRLLSLPSDTTFNKVTRKKEIIILLVEQRFCTVPVLAIV